MTPIGTLRGRSAVCFDAGSRYCPCPLATLGRCVACSILRGEPVCDCGWSGSCVYQKYLFDGSREMPGRTQGRATVEKRESLAASGEAFFLDVAVERELAAWAIFPGTFVMLRPEGRPERWNVPLSVMDAKDSRLRLAVETRGPKTATLSLVCVPGAGLTVAGPFWSGIQGTDVLRRNAGGNTLVVAKGVSQAALPQTAAYVFSRGGSMKALLGPGTLGAVFVEPVLRASGAKTQTLERRPDHNIPEIGKELSSGDYDLLLSLGSDAQHRELLALSRSLEREPAFAYSSNLSMTCGDGICGSCLVKGFRGCKASLPDAMLSKEG